MSGHLFDRCRGRGRGYAEAVKIAVRTLTVLGIVYLLVCGVCLGVLAARDRKFHRTGPTTIGTVVEVSAAPNVSRLGPVRVTRRATISWTIDGRSGQIESEVPARSALHVGAKVPLVYDAAGITDEDPTVWVKDTGIKPMAAMSLFLLFGAGLVACIAVFRLVQTRRPRDAAGRPRDQDEQPSAPEPSALP